MTPRKPASCVLLLGLCGAVAAAADGDEEATTARVQSTYVWQNKRPFPARYSGPNSLSPADWRASFGKVYKATCVADSTKQVAVKQIPDRHAGKPLRALVGKLHGEIEPGPREGLGGRNDDEELDRTAKHQQSGKEGRRHPPQQAADQAGRCGGAACGGHRAGFSFCRRRRGVPGRRF